MTPRELIDILRSATPGEIREVAELLAGPVMDAMDARTVTVEEIFRAVEARAKADRP